MDDELKGMIWRRGRRSWDTPHEKIKIEKAEI
jgi:hypothetical protein